jgi:signal transduction histidine kinase
VNELIYEILPLVELDARAHEVDLQLELDESVPSVQADGVQLQQVLLNLTRNAVEAMSSSGGHGHGRRLVIRTGVRNEDEIEVAVQDTGEGVPAALRAQLFEPFFTTKAEGMGLGLSLSRSICESHGGTLRYDAAEHGGSIFRIWLPTAPEEE